MKGNYKKHDIVMVDFGENSIGSEQKHIRPALIVQNDKGNYFSSCTIVIPISSALKGLHIPEHVLIEKNESNGLKVDSVLLCEQLRAVSEQRIIKKIGIITEEKFLQEIKPAIYANFN